MIEEIMFFLSHEDGQTVIGLGMLSFILGSIMIIAYGWFHYNIYLPWRNKRRRQQLINCPHCTKTSPPDSNYCTICGIKVYRRK